MKWLRFYEGGGRVEETQTKWTLQRVAWRAGELRMGEAAEHLERLLRLGDPVSQYAVLWGLCRTGTTAQADALHLYAMDPGYTGRMAREGLRRILTGEERSRFLEMQRARISWTLRDKLDPLDVPAFTELLASGVHDREISRVYLEDSSDVHASLCGFVAAVPLTERNTEALNELFQAAFLRGDSAMFGVVAHRLEEKAPVPYKARRRFQRRTRRSLRRTAQADPATYLELAMGVLTAAATITSASDAKGSLLDFTLSHARTHEAIWRGSSAAHKEALRTSSVEAIRYFGNTLI